MSVSTGKNGVRKKVSPVAVGIAAAALILFIGWRAWVAFAPISAGPLPPPPTQDINFINQKAQECQGQFDKLSPMIRKRCSRFARFRSGIDGLDVEAAVEKLQTVDIAVLTWTRWMRISLYRVP